MKMVELKYVLCLIVSTFFYTSFCVADQWTWSYGKQFSFLESLKHVKNGRVLFGKNQVNPFSQLIFSFNAFRPASGNFSFYVKTRDAKRKTWGKWHKMIDWGKGIQKSYFSKDTRTKYVYVRLETDLQNLADAFCLKVEAHNGASLRLVKGLFVCVSDFNKFRNEFFGKRLSSLPSVYVARVPKISQRVLKHPHANCLCSPTSCSMLAGYFNKKKCNACVLANKVFDFGLNVYGSWPCNIAALYNACHGNVCFCTKRMNSFEDIHKKLKSNIPVVVSVRGAIKGAPKGYKSGHLMVIVGWDAGERKVICHDPAFYSDKRTFVRYDVKSFLRAWERSHRLAYVAEIKGKFKK